jgi:DNA-binding HxlR family transcriptional regulator
LLSDSINASILRLLARGSLESADLGERLRNVSRSTRFERLRELEGLGVIVREKRAGTPPVTECRLTGAGVRLLPVAALLEAWLDAAPAGSLVFGDSSATGTIKALTLGWGSTLLRWLAERPHSLSELEPLVGEVGYRELERILRNLIEVGLAERVTGKRRLRPYTVTSWARQSTAPIAAAVRWERNEIPDCGAAFTAIDAESGLLLALPLIEPPADLNGACVLLVDIEAPGDDEPGRIAARVADGRLAACAQVAEPELSNLDGWVRGDMLAWLDALIEGYPAKLETGGDIGLAEGLVTALHEALFRRSGLVQPIGRLFESS